MPLRPVAVALPALLAVLLLAGWLGARLPPAEGAAGAVVSPGSQPSAPPTSRSSPPPSGPSGPSLRPSPSPAASASPDWRAVLTGLDDARERLFAAPDERQIGAVDAPGSSAYAYDLAAVRALRRDGAAARGARSDLTFLRVRQAGQWRTDLEVVDTLRKHTIVRVTPGAGARPGAVLEVRPAPPPRHSVLSLVRTDQGWRVAAVTSL